MEFKKSSFLSQVTLVRIVKDHQCFQLLMYPFRDISSNKSNYVCVYTHIHTRIHTHRAPIYTNDNTLTTSNGFHLFIFWLCLRHADLRSPTRDQTHASCTGSCGVLTTGLPGKSPFFSFNISWISYHKYIKHFSLISMAT